MASTTSLLLRNGTLLILDAKDHITSPKADLLVVGNKISKIAANISPPEGSECEITDCTDKIISPGFVDTHHHVWQTLLKGLHADELLLDYMITGEAFAS